MDNPPLLTLKSLVAASAAAALLGVGAVPAAHAGPKLVVKDTTTETVTDTTKDTKVAPGGRKVG